MTKTIAEKLQIKPNTTVWLSDPARLPLLTPMPDGVREADAMATASTAVLFAEDAARHPLAAHQARRRPGQARRALGRVSEGQQGRHQP